MHNATHKPDLSFDKDGICSACKFYEERKSINWELRKKNLKKYLKI